MHQNVIFTGPTGIEKKVVIKAAAEEFLRGKVNQISSLSADDFFSDTDVKRYIRYFSLEEEVKKITKRSIPILLDEQDPETQRSYWKKGWQKLFEKIEAVPPDVSLFIELHLSYFRRQKRFILHDPADILKLEANCFVTLLDDVYAIYFRIKKREETKATTGSYLRLQDILEWRNLEAAFSDCFAASQRVENYIVPVKHPACMLYRLIFERDQRKRIYASYPISKPRQRSRGASIQAEGDVRTEGQREIDEHRLRLYQGPNIIFDPVCMDERALQFAFQSVYGDNSITSIPGGCLFSIVGGDLDETMYKGFVPGELKNAFEANGIILTENLSILPLSTDHEKITEWKLTDEERKNSYVIAKEETGFNVYSESLSKKMIELERHHRWPLILEEFPPMLQDPPELFPLVLPAEEIHSIIYRPKKGQWKSHIDTQIENRDFCFICNAEYMAIYRPRWKGQNHEGVKTETKYASGKIPRIAYYPNEDVEKGRSPFGEEYEETYSDKDKFYLRLNNLV